MIRIYLIEPDSQIEQRLAESREIEIVGRTDSPLPDWNRNLDCDLVLVGATLANDCFARLARTPENGLPKIVVMDAEENKETLLPYFEAGAAGYVPNGASPAKTVAALEAILAGRPVLSSSITSALVARMRELALEQKYGKPDAPLYIAPVSLTPRERQILELIGNGLANQEIAAQLTIEPGTVKNHVHKILKKLGVSNRAQAAEYYALACANESV